MQVNTDLNAGLYTNNAQPIYSADQLKNFSKAVSINSSSMVVNNKKEVVDLALKNKDLLKDKIIKKKDNKERSLKRMQKVQEYNKSLSEQFQKERYNFKKQQKEMGKHSVPRKLSQTSNTYIINLLCIGSALRDLPYGLKHNLQKVKIENENKPLSDSKPAEKQIATTRTNYIFHESKTYEAVNDSRNHHKSMQTAPMTSEELKVFIEQNEKRRDSKFLSKKEQDELTSRLLSSRDKLLCKTTLEFENNMKQKSSFANSQKPKASNTRSFYENQVEHERVKHRRLINQMLSKTQEEMSLNQNPQINEESKRIASSIERKGKVHDRLHNLGKRKLLKQAQDFMNDLSNDREGRSGS